MCLLRGLKLFNMKCLIWILNKRILKIISIFHQVFFKPKTWNNNTYGERISKLLHQSLLSHELNLSSNFGTPWFGHCTQKKVGRSTGAILLTVQNDAVSGSSLWFKRWWEKGTTPLTAWCSERLNELVLVIVKNLREVSLSVQIKMQFYI